MTTFDSLGLNSAILSGIEELGFKNPTPVQEKIIPEIIETDRDIIGLAQTGTGKTAAFGLPVLQGIDTKQKFVQALILSPTRELCIQITKDLKNYSRYLKGMKITPVYGGASIESQIRDLRSGVHVIVATPGRMVDLIKRRAADVRDVKTVILDEADEMLNMGFKEELDAILDTTPKFKRTFLFSATMSKEVSRIATNYLNSPVKVTIGIQNSGAENIRHQYYQVHARNKYLALKRIADINPDIYGIVFCRTRAEAKDVAEKLIRDGYNAEALHGDLSQVQREHVMTRFRDRALQLLVATDVAARGIDVNDISHIINYQLPEDLDVYTHRSGRTGRANKSGVSISIVNYREVSKIKDIERIIHKSMERMPVPSGEEICEKRLFQLIDRMENVIVDEEQIAPFMKVVNKKLEWLSREQIIKHFVSLEFNRFLEYYRDAIDLNEVEKMRPRKSKVKRKSGKNGKPEEGFARFFINIGKKDGVAPKNIIGLINDNTNEREINIGAIDIKDSFSFFEVDNKYSDTIKRSFNKSHFKGRKLRIDLATEPIAPEKKRRRKRKSF